MNYNYQNIINENNYKRFAEILEEISQFLLNAHQQKGRIDFTNAHVPQFVEEIHFCNTVACHGGWLGIWLNQKLTNYQLHSYDEFPIHFQVYLLKELYDPDYKYDEELPEVHFYLHFHFWASNNPDLWGNKNGAYMYSGDGHIAFYDVTIPEFRDRVLCKPLPKVDLELISKHYHGVSQRVLQKFEGVQS